MCIWGIPFWVMTGIIDLTHIASDAFRVATVSFYTSNNNNRKYEKEEAINICKILCLN